MPNAPPYMRFPEVRTTAKRHIHWRKITTYTTVYKRGRTRVTVKSLREPPPTRLFRTSKGNMKFKAVSIKPTTREVIIVARTKNRKKPVETEEIEELEALEDLEDLDEDEEEEEDVEVEDDDEPDDEEDEDDEDEEPAPKRGKKSSKAPAKKPAKKSESRAAANGKVGTQELAEHLGIDGRALRVLLRRHEIPKDPDTGRYEWSSLSHKTVKRIEKLVNSGEAKRAQQEQFAKLKEKSASKKAAKTKAPAKKSSKKRKVVEEDEDDDE